MELVLGGHSVSKLANISQIVECYSIKRADLLLHNYILTWSRNVENEETKDSYEMLKKIKACHLRWLQDSLTGNHLQKKPTVANTRGGDASGRDSCLQSIIKFQ